MGKAATTRSIRGAGIVLGLYFAALLLSGPLHFLMHPAVASSCGGCEEQTTAFNSIQPGTTAYNLHHCPACFLHSHSVAGDQSSSFEAVLTTSQELIDAFTEHVFDAEKSFSLRNRAPPFAL